MAGDGERVTQLRLAGVRTTHLAGDGERVTQLRLAGVRTTHLAGDGERVTQLRLAGAELAKELRDGAGLDAALQQLVELLRAGRHLDDLRPLLVELGCRREAHRHQLLRLRLRAQLVLLYCMVEWRTASIIILHGRVVRGVGHPGHVEAKECGRS